MRQAARCPALRTAESVQPGDRRCAINPRGGLARCQGPRVTRVVARAANAHVVDVFLFFAPLCIGADRGALRLEEVASVGQCVALERA